MTPVWPAIPVLIGALTVLVTIVAVYLAYNANNGLPFVPTYTLHVQAANASELTHGDDVNMGGALVGVRLDRHADAAAQRPADRADQPEAAQERRAAAGRLDVHGPAEGRDRAQVPADHPRPLQPRVPQRRDGPDAPDEHRGGLRPGAVDVHAGDAQGRPATTIGFGEALAGRGYDINSAIGAFLPLLRDLQPVAAQPRVAEHRPRRLLPRPGELHRRAGPGGRRRRRQLFANLDTTFRALAGVAVPSLQETISETPPTFEATITDAPVIRPVPDRHRGAVHRAAARRRPRLPQSAPVLAERVRHRDAQPAGDRGARPADGRAVEERSATTARTRRSSRDWTASR